MERHLERALIELYYALADFEQAKESAAWRGKPDQSESLLNALSLARWGLETALRGLCEIKAAALNDAAR
jgi:hypothetical protein